MCKKSLLHFTAKHCSMNASAYCSIWFWLNILDFSSKLQICVPVQSVYKFNWTNFQEISRRFQEGFQEQSRTCLRCFGMLRNVPNLLVCLNIKQKHDMHNMGAVEKIKRATSFLNKRSGTQFYHDWKPMQSTIDMLHKNFQEGHTNSRRFPGFQGGFLNSSRFPGVVDTLLWVT